jgi:type IV pilus assembly protein PilM
VSVNFAFRERRLLSLDWDQHAVRLVLVGLRRGRMRLIRALAVPLPAELDQSDAEAMGGFLRRVIGQQRLHAPRAMINIPRDQAVLHTLTVPPTPPEDLPALVHFQIVKELPFAQSEAVVDFAGTGQQTSDQSSDVLVAAVRNEVLQHCLRICRHAGLKVERVGLRPYANLAAVARTMDGGVRGQVLFVDVGPTLTEIDLIAAGQLAFSRAASVGITPLIEPGAAPTHQALDAETKQTLDQLLVEVTRSIEAYRAAKPGAVVDQVVVAGSSGLEHHLAEALAKRFRAPARFFNPAEALGMPSEAGAAMVSFSAPLGLALGHSEPGLLRFDFLHPKKAEKPGARRAKLIPRVAAVVALFSLAAGVAYGQWYLGKREQLHRAQEQVRSLRARLEKAKTLQELVAAACEWRDGEVIFLDELLAVTEAFPDTTDAYLANYRAGESPVIRMQVRAIGNQFGNELAKRLNETGWYDATPGKSIEGSGQQRFNYTADIKVTRNKAPMAERKRENGLTQPAADEPADADEQPEAEE